MATYLFRRNGPGLAAEGALAVAVKAAVQEIFGQEGTVLERWGAIETPDMDGGYVLVGIVGEMGWHYHQEALFRRHGITCKLYPTA